MRQVDGPAPSEPSRQQPVAAAPTRQPTLETTAAASSPSKQPSADSEPPAPTEPPPDLDLSPVHPVESPPEPAHSQKGTEGVANDLLSQAMDDRAVQTMLEVFTAEIKDVEEI